MTSLFVHLYLFRSSTYGIKWVDDTHALIIFATEELGENCAHCGEYGNRQQPCNIMVQLYKVFVFSPTAEQALTVSYAVFRLRPIYEGTAHSIRVAERCAGRHLLILTSQ